MASIFLKRMGWWGSPLVFAALAFFVSPSGLANALLKRVLPASNQCVLLIEASSSFGYRLTAPDSDFDRQLRHFAKRLNADIAGERASQLPGPVSLSSERSEARSIEGKAYFDPVWVGNWGDTAAVVDRLIA